MTIGDLLPHSLGLSRFSGRPLPSHLSRLYIYTRYDIDGVSLDEHHPPSRQHETIVTGDKKPGGVGVGHGGGCSKKVCACVCLK